jgi:hypothetical protein
MIEVSFAIGDTFYLANMIKSTDLATHRCAQCGGYFTGPCPIMRGTRGETVIVCRRCKSERDTGDVTDDMRARASQEAEGICARVLGG